MADALHVVSFNVPWPANYGGVIDVYYRIKALAEAGVKVHLHCFTYGRSEAPELERLCASVHYYRRNMSPLLHLGRRPFIVSSRDCADLWRRLRQDRLPILLEGVHCCALLEHADVEEGRCVVVRAHNIEADYYAQLARTERRLPKRLYLRLEARKLRRYEPILTRATAVLAVTQADSERLTAMGCRRVEVMPCCHPYEQVLSLPGRGSYAFYHGDLSVPDNEAAARFLIEELFGKSSHRLVVAGFKPTERLRALAERHPNVTVVDTPDADTMSKLMAEAQLNILVTNQPTGMKLKLLYALFCGRYCVVNSAMIAGTDLGELCEVADGAKALREASVPGNWRSASTNCSPISAPTPSSLCSISSGRSDFFLFFRK